MSCPNPSAHPVGVRHARETARSCRTVGSDSSLPCPDLALAAAVGFVPSTPAQAEPDIDDVQARVDRLYHEAEQASERYNDAKLELADLKRDLDSLQADQDRQDDQLEAVRDEVQDSIVRQYQGESLSAVGQVVVSDDPSAFLSQLSTMSAFNAAAGPQLFDDYATEVEGARHPPRGDPEACRPRSPSIEEQLGRREGRRSTTSSPRPRPSSTASRRRSASGDRSPAAATAAARPTSRPPAAPPPRSQYAMAQVGDAYVYGAAGPSAFDCSGLTMMAWAQAGVALPHSSSAQYGSGPHIAASDLQPGDLVFYYSPISHVGMYIGNGMIVHAANPGAGVRGLGPVLDAVTSARSALADSTRREGRSPTLVGGRPFAVPAARRRRARLGASLDDDPYVAPAPPADAGPDGGPRARRRGAQRARGRGRRRATWRAPSALAARRTTQARRASCARVVENAEALGRRGLLAALRRRGLGAVADDGSWHGRRRRRPGAFARLRPRPGAGRGAVRLPRSTATGRC